jgi:hypothetical protein
MVAKPKQAKSKKPWVIAGAVAALAAAAGGAVALWPKNHEKLVAELAQKPPEEIRKAVESGQVPREVAWEAFGEARRVEFEKRIDAYFALNSQAERQKFLDKMIDEMEAQRKRWEVERAQRQQSGQQWPRREGGPATRPTTRPTDDRERQQRMMARMDARPAARQAQMIEFRNAMAKRMQERGIQGGRGFGPGGPGGGPGGGFGGGGRRGN